jgi:hypothetical protein
MCVGYEIEIEIESDSGWAFAHGTRHTAHGYDISFFFFSPLLSFPSFCYHPLKQAYLAQRALWALNHSSTDV